MGTGEVAVRGLVCLLAIAIAALAQVAAAQQQTQRASAIPSTTATPTKSAPAAAAKPPAVTPAKKVDLNNATLEELKALPTVGDADAKKIIAYRPYSAKGELVTKAGLPEGVYYAVRHHVELQPPRKQAAKK